MYFLESTATISRLQTLENGVGAASAQDEGEAIEMREQIAAMHSVIAGRLFLQEYYEFSSSCLKIFYS